MADSWPQGLGPVVMGRLACWRCPMTFWGQRGMRSGTVNTTAGGSRDPAGCGAEGVLRHRTVASLGQRLAATTRHVWDIQLLDCSVVGVLTRLGSKGMTCA